MKRIYFGDCEIRKRLQYTYVFYRCTHSYKKAIIKVCFLLVNMKWIYQWLVAVEC